MELQITPGFTTCPSCVLGQRYMEPYTAIPSADGRVYCYSCKNVSGSIPREALEKFRALPGLIHGIVSALISFDTDGVEDLLFTYGKVDDDNALPATFNLLHIKGPGDGDDAIDGQRAAAAVAQGNAHVLIEEAQRTNITLGCGPANQHRVRISYLPQADLDGAYPATDAQAVLDQDQLHQPQVRAVRILTEAGFSVFAHDLSSALRRVALRRGEGANAVQAELSWHVA